MEEEIKAVAYRLWESRNKCSFYTDDYRNYMDAKKMLETMTKEDIDSYINNLPYLAASEEDDSEDIWGLYEDPIL